MTARLRELRPRSILIAVILSGLGPGAGHLYAGRPLRGAILVAAATASAWGWTFVAAKSLLAAQLGLLPSAILLLAVIVDSGRLARRATRPWLARPINRWWWYVAAIVITGGLLPAALSAALAANVGLVRQPDSLMAPDVALNDLVVVDRRAFRVTTPHRGDVVVLRHVAGGGDGDTLRRVVGLPGDTIEVRRGLVHVNGAVWTDDDTRSFRAASLTFGPVEVGRDEVLAISDRRSRIEASTKPVRVESVMGRVTWLLLPGDRDFTRFGEPLR